MSILGNQEKRCLELVSPSSWGPRRSQHPILDWLPKRMTNGKPQVPCHMIVRISWMLYYKVFSWMTVKVTHSWYSGSTMIKVCSHTWALLWASLLSASPGDPPFPICYMLGLLSRHSLPCSPRQFLFVRWYSLFHSNKSNLGTLSLHHTGKLLFLY